MKINYTDEQTEAMKRLYGQFVKPGDLVFNVGANVGMRTQIFVDLGARVVAVDPQPEMADVLRRRFKDHDVLVVECAVGANPGRVPLWLCTDNQLATCDRGWAESLQDRWPLEKWGESITVTQTTLDVMLAINGIAHFIKIDVEGYEREVLAGLSLRRVDGVEPILRSLCFEATIPFVGPALDCVDDLAGRLGFTEFNYIVQETMELVLDEWVSGDWMKDILVALPESTFYVDVFAR